LTVENGQITRTNRELDSKNKQLEDENKTLKGETGVGRVRSQLDKSQSSAPMNQGVAPQTWLERVTQINRNLPKGDRDRLADALFDFSKNLDQANTLMYSARDEGGQLSNAWQSGSIVKELEMHSKKLREIDSSAKDFYKSLSQVFDKWKYYPEQTNYVFGDNPYNLGPHSIMNATEGYANYLDRWAAIQNKNQREILNLLESEQVQYDELVLRFIQWKQGCQQRLDEMKKSLQ
jgi:hypothetical protein